DRLRLDHPHDSSSFAALSAFSCVSACIRRFRLPEKGDRLPKSKRLLLSAAATAAVTVAGTWGAVAMAASSPKSHSTPKSHTAPKAHAGHNCPHMGNAASTAMYSPSDV